jgi:hypothetical protein
MSIKVAIAAAVISTGLMLGTGTALADPTLSASARPGVARPRLVSHAAMHTWTTDPVQPGAPGSGIHRPSAITRTAHK